MCTTTRCQHPRHPNKSIGWGATASAVASRHPAANSAVVRILEPLGTGYYYSDLDPNEVVALSWLETNDKFMFKADVGSLMQTPGVYTVVVWRDTGGVWLEEVLVELSVFVK